MQNSRIQVVIEALVKGNKDVDSLAKDLRDLGDVVGDDLKEGALEAAQALEALGSKQNALAAFKELGAESRKVGNDLDKASASVDKLGAELVPVVDAARAFAKAEEEARAAVVAAQEALTRQKDLLRTTRTEADAATKKTLDYKQSVTGLKAAIAASKQQLEEKRKALAGAATASSQAAQAERVLQKEYGAAVSSAQRLSRELSAKNVALADARSRMAELGISTSNLAQHERNLQTAVQQVRQEVERMAPAFQQAASKASASTLQQAEATRTLREGVGDLGAQLQRIQSIAMVALGGNWAMGKAKEVAEVADAFKNLQARVQLATGEGALFESSWERISRIALDTNSALDGTATLFARVADAGKSAGLSAETAAQQSLGLVETINQAVQLSGASAQASDAAITQLIQGLQSGVLRGEEFNSVMEQAPRLAKALADGLGVTTGELRKMAGQGALTTEVVIKALQGQSDVVAAEFEKLPATVGRALQNLSTQWMLYVGGADAGLLSSENAAKAIDFLAQNLDTLVNTLQTAGKLWAAIKVAQLAGDFGAWATKTLTATAAMEANTVATAANTAAQKANAAAVGASATALGAQATAAKASAFVQAEMARNAKNAAIFSGQAAKAQQAANSVMSGGAAAAGRAASGIGLLGGAVRGVTALMGGPVGLIATLLLFNQEIKSGITSVVEWGMGFTEAGKRMRQFEQEQERVNASLAHQAEMAKEAAAAQLRYAQAQAEARDASFGLTQAGRAAVATFDGMIKAGERADEALAKIGKDFDLSTAPGIQNAAAVLDQLVADGKISAEQFKAAWDQALSGVDLGMFEVQARAALSGAARESEQLAQVLDASLRQAVQRTGLDFDNLQGKVSASSRSAINDVDAIAGAFERLEAQGMDAGLALEQSLSKAINTADSEEALSVLSGKIDDVRKRLGDKVANGFLDEMAKKAKQLREALEDATPGIQSVGEAMRRLGIVSDESLQEVAKEAKAAFDVVRTSGTASTREVAESFERAAEAAIAAGNGVAPAWVKSQAALHGYKVTVDKAGKATLELSDATDKSANSHDRAARSVRGHMTELERLNAAKEREIAAQEKANELKERELELYQKKWNIDKEGYSLNTAGERVGMTSLSRTAVLQMAKQQGLDDAAALRVVDSFGDKYENKPGLLGGLQGGVSPNEVNKAIADAVLQQARRKAVEDAAAKSATPGGTARDLLPDTDASASVVSLPVAASPAPAPAPSVQIHRHEFSIKGESFSIDTDADGSRGVEKLLRHLEQSKNLSGY